MLMALLPVLWVAVVAEKSKLPLQGANDAMPFTGLLKRIRGVDAKPG